MITTFTKTLALIQIGCKVGVLNAEGDKLQGYVHNMAQSTKHRQQLTRSKQTTERPARKPLVAR
jgi:hypothetical protein